MDTIMHGLLVLAFVTTVLSRDCVTKNQCSCTFDDDGSVVDITSIGNSDNTPRFKDVFSSAENYYYSYNPCFAFTEGECTGAAACLLNTDKTQQITIGDAVKGSFLVDPVTGNLTVSYDAGSGNLRSSVILQCDPNACDPVFTPVGQQGLTFFTMTLKHACACPGGCTASGSPKCNGSGSGGLSGGSVILILFFSLVIIYLVGGTLFMKIKVKAQGSDIIPNKSLWLSVPGLIKAGFMFTIGKCRRQRSSYQGI